MLKRTLIFAHRWLGVAMCLLFSMWFASGIVMMYWDFPSVTPADRLQHSPSLDASKIKLSPAEAFAKLNSQVNSRPNSRPNSRQSPSQVLLNTFDGRPVYRFRMGREQRVVFADTGEFSQEITREIADRIAAAWAKQPAASAKVESIEEADQWTVQGPLRNLRPLRKYSWPNDDQVYLSGVTGEVVQSTTRSSRIWAYLGPIPHWLYFTPLRVHQVAWSNVVIWSSGIATVTAMLGLILGVWVYFPRKRVPYKGQKRWHMILGLIFGVVAVTWAFSGMLSMDPFPASGPKSAGPNFARALRGEIHIQDFDARLPSQLMLDGVKEMELISFGGDPFYLARFEDRTRVIPVHGEPVPEFDRGTIIRLVKSVVGPNAEAHVIDRYDAYYRDRRHMAPLPVILVTFPAVEGTQKTERTQIYIDPKTARVVASTSSQGWVNRWLYHGLHSFDFPWLYEHRPLWDILVISLLLGGMALCVTSLILAWRMLIR